MEQKAGMVQDKVVIVTGAGRGIGQAIAKMMAACGAKVVVNDIGTSVNGEGRDLGPAQDTADQITAAGGQAVAVEAVQTQTVQAVRQVVAVRAAPARPAQGALARRDSTGPPVLRSMVVVVVATAKREAIPGPTRKAAMAPRASLLARALFMAAAVAAGATTLQEGSVTAAQVARAEAEEAEAHRPERV